MLLIGTGVAIVVIENNRHFFKECFQQKKTGANPMPFEFRTTTPAL
jgi:hypothetical protein